MASTENSSNQRAWIIAPGENAGDWPAFRDGSFVAVVLIKKDLGDLRAYKDAADIGKAIQKLLPDSYASGPPRNLNRYAFRFTHDVAVGDYVFVREGRKKIIGAGRITSDYQHVPSATHFKHRRSVEWINLAVLELPPTVSVPIIAFEEVERDSDLWRQLKGYLPDLSRANEIPEVPISVEKAVGEPEGSGPEAFEPLLAGSVSDETQPAMGYLAAYQYDVFISYAAANDQDGWVKRFQEALAREAEQFLGWKISIFLDDNLLRGDDVFSEGKANAIMTSAVLIPIVSPSYLNSAYCKRELEQFLVASRRGADSKIRVCTVAIIPFDRELLPNPLHDVQYISFFEEANQAPLKPGSADWNNRVRKVALEIIRLLKELRRDSSTQPDLQRIAPPSAAEPASEARSASVTGENDQTSIVDGSTSEMDQIPTLDHADKEDADDRTKATKPGPESVSDHEAANRSSDPDVPLPTNLPATSASATPIPAPVAADPEFDPVSFVTRLTPGAVTALLRAEGYRVALGQKRLHMEHLLLGLYGQADSPIRRLARTARIYDERGFQRSLSTVNALLTGDVNPVPQMPPITLSLLSRHVREAFVAAQKVGGQRIGRNSLLGGAMTVDCGALNSLRSAAVPRQRAEGSIGQRDWIIGVSSDVPGGRAEDLLNLQRDVNALCSVIAAADAALPLSIGLFGEWGSGKSFFMNMMEQRLGDLQEVGPPAFCSKIVQLKFNAWHYMDTSLWASLTSEIFEGLATKLSTSPGPEPANRAAKLLESVSTSRDRLAEAERQKETAKVKLAESEVRLQELSSSEAKIRASLSPRVLFTEATRLAFEQKEVKEGFERAAKELNLPQAVDSGAEVNRDLVELRGIFSAILVAMRNTEQLWIWILALALVALAAFGIPLLAHTYLHGQWDYLKAAITAAATVLTGVVALLGPFFVPARRALIYLQEARKKSDELVSKKKEEKYNELKVEYDKRKEEVDKQEKAVNQERKVLEGLQEAVEHLRADRQMLDFIKRRNASTDYTSHLGVVARAHKDFKELSAILERVALEPPQTDLPRVDRIVLYIDDLDRCPEDKVMDVLQAVHLLLAFPLFVVVVGVDPRWLLHSVAVRSTPLRHDGNDENGFEQSTPLDYLEKIFQIPFTLSPMSDVGFGSLVDKVAGSVQGDKKETQSPTVRPSTVEIPLKSVGDERQEKTRVVVTPAPELAPARSAPFAPASPTKTRKVSTSAAEPLKIEPWELDYMKKLYCLIPSPRAGKRFINIYRMIRSTVDDEHWQEFVGEEQQGGDHRQALLLLAILTGYPGEASEILRQLIERVHNETWWEFIDTLNATSGNWAELRVKLRSLRALVADTEGCDAFRRYAASVARYSFQSGRVLLAVQLPEADN